MKPNIRFLNALRAVALGVAGILVAGSVGAQSPASPVGPVWDCVLGGKGQRGIAFITFQADYTFSGYQVLAGESIPADDVDGRNPGGDVGRGYDFTNNDSKTNVYVYGFDQFTGRWAYDAKGRVIGSFMQVTDGEEENVDTITNSVSFTAKVVPGKRLSLVSSTSQGDLTYRGVPYKATFPSLNGDWYGNKTVKKQTLVEFYSLTSVVDDNPWADTNPDLSSYPGIYYTLDGEGASYEFAGFCLLSSQKKVAYAFESYPVGGTNGVLSATFGNFSNGKGGMKASTKGLDPVTGKYSYTAMQPMVVPVSAGK
jgi:hypothetical protein